MFDYCIDNGLIDGDVEIDRMNLRSANMVNTIVPPEELERLRDKAWDEVNSDDWKNNRKSLAVRVEE